MKKVITVLAVVLVLAGAAAGYWFTRPIYRAQKAMEEKNLVKVSEYYSKLKDEEKGIISHDVLLYAGELLDSYVEQDSDYDDVMDELENISDEMISDESGFQNIFDGMEMYKESRDSWEKANKYFEKEEYDKALEEYSKVVKGDYPYDDAQDRIEECRENMVSKFVGKWICKLEVGEGMLAAEGLDEYGEDVLIPVTFIMEVSEDKTATLSIDVEEFMDGFNKYVDNLIEISVKKLAIENGLSESEVNRVIKKSTGMSFREYVNTAMNLDDMGKQISEAKDEYTYEIGKDKLVFTNTEGEKMEVKVGNDVLMIDDLDASTKRDYDKLGVKLPLEFVRE